MAQHHFVVLIDQAAWRIAHFVGHDFSALREFGPTEDGRLEGLRWCQKFPRAIISFLTNLADEHYHVETLPHVRGSTGRQLLMRKLSAWPFAQGMHAMVRLDAVQTLRLEQRFLFAGLVYPSLASWFSVLNTKPPKIQGLYTQALILPGWLPTLPKGVVHRLCIQCTPQQVRISYLRHHRLFFSRLIPLPQTTFPELGDWFNRIAQEASQVRMTISQQRWLLDTDVLQLTWLGEVPQEVGALKKYLPASCLWTCLSAPELIRQLGCRSLPEGLGVMDWAAMQPVLHGHALPNLAPEEALLPTSMLRIKRYLHWAGAAMMGMLLLTGYAGIVATQHTWSRVHELNQQLHRWATVKPASDINLAQLPRVRALTKSTQALETSRSLPDRGLFLVQQAVSGISCWQFMNLQWESSLPSDVAAVSDANNHASPVGRETLTLSLSALALNDQAIMEWQQLLSRLHELPEIEKVEVLRESDAAGISNHHGGTRLPLSKEPVLKLYLRPAEEVSVL